MSKATEPTLLELIMEYDANSGLLDTPPRWVVAGRTAVKEIDRLTYELRVIGDMAVTDWNDRVVAKVDEVISQPPPKTYGEARRAELAQYVELHARIKELEAKIGR